MYLKTRQLIFRHWFIKQNKQKYSHLTYDQRKQSPTNSLYSPKKLAFISLSKTYQTQAKLNSKRKHVPPLSLQMYITSPKNIKKFTLIDKPPYLDEQSIRSTNLSDEILFQRHKSSPTNKDKTIQIFTIYHQIHSYIDSLQFKIRHILEKHENQYKIVYQHHFKTFRDELNQLKEKTLKQQKDFSSIERVKYIESQNIMLKSQAYKYKRQFQRHKTMNQILRRDIGFIKNQNQVLKQKVKAYMKDQKLITSVLDAKLTQAAKEYAKQNQNQLIMLQNSQHGEKMKLKKTLLLSLNNPTKKRSHSMDIDSFSKQLQSPNPQHSSNKSFDSIPFQIQLQNYQNQNSKIDILSQENDYAEISETHPQKQKQNCVKKIKEKNSQIYKSSSDQKKAQAEVGQQIKSPTAKGSFRQQKKSLGKSPDQFFSRQKSPVNSIQEYVNKNAQKHYLQFSISEWFLQCLQSVNKDILHRKSSSYSSMNSMPSQFLHFATLDDFKKADKMKVIQMFLSNQQIIKVVYELLKSQVAKQHPTPHLKINTQHTQQLKSECTEKETFKLNYASLLKPHHNLTLFSENRNTSSQLFSKRVERKTIYNFSSVQKEKNRPYQTDCFKSSHPLYDIKSNKKDRYRYSLTIGDMLTNSNNVNSGAINKISSDSPTQVQRVRRFKKSETVRSEQKDVNKSSQLCKNLDYLSKILIKGSKQQNISLKEKPTLNFRNQEGKKASFIQQTEKLNPSNTVLKNHVNSIGVNENNYWVNREKSKPISFQLYKKQKKIKISTQEE